MSSIPFAATGLVICWNLPMNRERSSHSSLVARRVSLSSSCAMKSNTIGVVPPARIFALRTASVT